MNEWQDEWERVLDDEVFYTPPSRLRRLLVVGTRNLAALGFFGFLGLTVWVYNVSSAAPNPATGQIVREHARYGGHYYLTPAQHAWGSWGRIGTMAFCLFMLYAHRLIATYDPGAVKLAPRSPGVDPFAGDGKR